MAKPRKANADPEPGAIDLLEESIHRLRQTPAAAFAQYYGATLPFVLALLYFWADFSRNADAAGRGAGAALSLAALFVAMKTGQAAFAGEIRAGAAGKAPAPWTLRRLARTACVQGVIQPTGLFIVPVAVVVTLPLGWVFAFYQNATALGAGESGSAWPVAARALSAAMQRPRQNHAALAILSLLGMFVWFNILISVFLLPQLLRQFTGEENMFTRSGTHLFNSTFFAVTVALVYLAVDPLVKTFYALRCYHFDALRTGEDLKVALNALPPVRARAATLTTIAALLLLVLLPSGLLAAEEGVAPAELRRSSQQVLQRREFAWRLPPAPVVDQEPARDGPGFLGSIAQWFSEMKKAVEEWISRWFAREHPSEPSDGRAVMDRLRVGACLVLALAAVGIVYLLLRRRRKEEAVTGEAVAAGAPVDLADDTILANQLPEDEWLALAAQLQANGETRLALRAYYLSTLAALGARGLLAIARHKSNRDYLAEVQRRARDLADVPDAFARNVRRFERVWYGAHAASEELLARFQADRALIAAAAPPAPALP